MPLALKDLWRSYDKKMDTALHFIPAADTALALFISSKKPLLISPATPRLLLSFADTAAPALDELYRRSGDQPETEQQADEEDEEDEVEVVENATGMAPREGERAGDGGRDGDGGELTTTALGRNPVSTRLILL